MRHHPPVSIGARLTRNIALGAAALFVIAQPLSVLARSAPVVQPRAARAQTSDDALVSRGFLVDPDLASALDELSRQRRSGEPFAIQEIEILDAWEAGLPIAKVEADVLRSRAIYKVYMRNVPAEKIGSDVVGHWRAYALAHATDLQARNVKLNGELDKSVQPPDSSRDWELYSDPLLFNQLSSAAQTRLERRYGHKGLARLQPRSALKTEEPTSVSTPTNVQVNNPTADGTTQDTQSETAMVLGSGTNIISSFNDSGSHIPTSNNHFTGIARSTNGGTSFTDQGSLLNSTNGDAGDPVLARNATTGRIVLSTLGFTSAAALQMFRSDDDGATYAAPVDGDGGGTNNDKEWITCDNFAGTGQGNFYMFYRDFGGGGGMSFTRSTDGGVTWSSRILLASASGQGAWVVVGADHAVYCFWLAGTTIVVRKSTDLGVTFGAQSTVVSLTTSGTNGDLGLSGGFRTNAFPQVVCDPTSANRLYCVFNDVGVAGGDKADTFLIYSTDSGATWTPKRRVNSDSTTTDQWQPCLAMTPDGSGVFVSWYDRRGNGTAIGVWGTDGSICPDGSVAFVPDYAISDGTWPVVIGQDPQINTVYMGDYDQATADNSGFYRQWGDNRLSNTSHTNQPDVRFAKIPKSAPVANPQANGASIVAENCTPANNAIDPGETVTVSLVVKNVGGASTSNLVGTLLATGGVTSPSGPQTYGAIGACSATGSKNYTFTASGVCGGNIVASLQLQDGATNLGTVTFPFSLGVISAVPQTFSNPAGITINDNTTATPYPSNITVSGVTAGISRVTVGINGLTHTFPSDIDILLVGPGGQKSIVVSDAGGGTDVSNITFTIDPNAAGTVPDPIANGGVYKPTDTDGSDTFVPPAPAGAAIPDFSVFGGLTGSSVNGTWSLYVKDDAGTDTGTISGGWTLNVYTFTCSTTCGGGNTPPSITAGGPLARQQGSAASNSTIATVSDVETPNGSLVVTATSVPSGISVTNIVNTNGSVTADVAADCGALIGTNNVTLTVTDGGALTNTATLVVNVSANSLPTSGTYAAASVSLNGGTTVIPSPGPSDNGSIAMVTAVASSPAGFTGTLTGATNGNITVANAAPANVYTITVSTTDNCGSASITTFQLTVSPVSNVPPVADAGTDAPANACTVVQLNGSGSNDPDGGPSPLTYSWSQTAGPTVVITGATTSMPTFEAPNVAVSAALTFQLTVSDGAANNSDTVTITDNHVNGVNVDTPGLYANAASTFYLRNCNAAGPADITSSFGVPGFVPLRGDWDGNGTETLGAYDPAAGAFFFRNANTPGPSDIAFLFGPSNSVPLVGDWDGNGTVTAGIYIPATGAFFLKNTNGPGAADLAFIYGPGGAGITPVVGDWDGNGTTTIGIYVQSTGAWFLKNSNSPGAADLAFFYGPGGAGVAPIVGNWDGLGGDSVGIYVSASAGFFLKNTNAGGAADITLVYGPNSGGFTPLAGNWDGF